MIQVEGVSKRFGDIQAVRGISFEVRQGEIYGLLGPNGAGKTTTLSMIAGILAPDEGRIRFEGTDLAVDPIAVKQQLGVVPQEIALYEELTARENLRFWGGLYGLSGGELTRAIDEILEKVGLTARADQKVSGYSGGMKRRLNLSLGLVHQPKVVMMDEPTVGIDPQARANILEVVERIAASGTTVLYTTHYLEEAERFCQRIAIMDEGEILAEGTLDELKAMVGESETVTVRGSFDDGALERLTGIGSVKTIASDASQIVLATNGEGAGAVNILAAVLKSDLAVEGVSIQPPSLNGLFLELTGRELRD